MTGSELSLLLSVEGLSKRFGSNTVLTNVRFSVLTGEVLGLIGPNGAGKTTLFECLAGLIHADAGELEFRDRHGAPARRKQALFYLPDAIRPWADQRVKRALNFFGSLYARSSKEIVDTASGVALDPLMGSRIGSLSKGRVEASASGDRAAFSATIVAARRAI